MHTGRTSGFYTKTCWLLIIGLLVSTVLPLHMHLHHVDAAPTAAHEHAFDLHLVTDNAGADHHDEALVLSATPDALLKQVGDLPLMAALLFCLLGIFLFRNPSSGQRFFERDAPPRILTHHLTPPLRAPPLA